MSVDAYISQLNDQEKQVLAIAKDHLQDSFDIERSIGYQEWQKSQTQTQTSVPTQPPMRIRVVRRVKKRVKKSD